jgi:hypothetical protein
VAAVWRLQGNSATRQGFGHGPKRGYTWLRYDAAVLAEVSWVLVVRHMPFSAPATPLIMATDANVTSHQNRILENALAVLLAKEIDYESAPHNPFPSLFSSASGARLTNVIKA